MIFSYVCWKFRHWSHVLKRCHSFLHSSREYLEGFDTRVKIVQLTLKLLHFQALLDVARVSLFWLTHLRECSNFRLLIAISCSTQGWFLQMAKTFEAWSETSTASYSSSAFSTRCFSRTRSCIHTSLIRHNRHLKGLFLIAFDSRKEPTRRLPESNTALIDFRTPR